MKHIEMDIYEIGEKVVLKTFLGKTEGIVVGYLINRNRIAYKIYDVTEQAMRSISPDKISPLPEETPDNQEG